jgi:rifampicin phosphotransferase
MSMTVRFDEAGSDEKARVGGKGVNLGICAQQGFPVPAGFTVTTEAYAAFIAETGLQAAIAGALDGADYDDASELEARTARIRAAISETAMPQALAAEIADGYGTLGADTHLAVRSSGTAEDLAEASFAGLHDTFLNVHGVDAVRDAVRGCWASLWTARAVAYRQKQGLNDIAQVRMAVVVQTMVEPEVSGVMFTGNPITTAADEVVINASWGLGESVVQGAVTPDEFVVKAVRPVAVGFECFENCVRRGPVTLVVKSRTTGSKETRMVRDPQTAQGSITADVPAEERGRLTMTDAQVLELADLGRRVQAFYEEMPQDIEWALLDGSFYLLQARPITGVAFDWAADMDSFQWAPDDDEALWSGQFATLLTGAKSPLYYHWVSDADSAGYYAMGNALGIPELSGPSYYTNHDADLKRTARHQIHKYFRGEVYLNGEVEKIIAQSTFLPQLRSPDITPFLPPDYAAEVSAASFNYVDFVRAFAQLTLVAPDSGLFRVLDRVQEFVDVDTAGAFSDPDALPAFDSLSDDELKRAINAQWLVPAKYTGYSMILWFVYAQQMFALFARMIGTWYTGTNEHAFAEMCQGVNNRSRTLQENLGLYDLAEEIRASRELTELFEGHQDGDFFGALEGNEAGRAFLEHYREFVSVHGHRGHEDRDFGYPRRYEDPSIDIRSFKVLLSRDHPESPYELEQKLTARREAAFEDVMANVRRGGLTGTLKAEAIKTVYTWVQQFLAIRDDERWAYERSSFCAKLFCREIGRRLVDRGILEDQEDFLMFTKDELYDLLDNNMGVKLARAKATHRRIDYNRSLQRTHEFPMFIRDGREVAHLTGDTDGGLIGTGWTSGTVTATARVVNRLGEIGRVRQGEILVCQSTDPGWTPVFMLLSGIVIETGGVLAHAVCLSREYGLPAVQLPGARKLIPDGATITINGSTGEIVIVDTEEATAEAAHATPTNGNAPSQETTAVN